MRYFLVVLILGLAGCATPQELTSSAPLHKYRANISITIDGKEFDGMGVTALNGPKKIEIVSQAKLDLLKINSCHRDFKVEKVDKGWFGGSGKKFTYNFVPTEKEKSMWCPLYIQAFDKRGITDWGYLAWRDGFTLPAQMDCNGHTWKFAGVSVCQTQAGLEQVIRFEKPVKYSADSNCKITSTSDRSFNIRSNQDFCLAEFSSDGKEFHRMVLLGYEKDLIRGD